MSGTLVGSVSRQWMESPVAVILSEKSSKVNRLASETSSLGFGRLIQPTHSNRKKRIMDFSLLLPIVSKRIHGS
jgi:hypothetical protein